jgi:prepilin-type N-terminal cleavage/methylation domain-containing protein
MGSQVLTGASARRERGVTLIEVIVAMVILTVVLLGMGRFAVGFTRTVRQSDARTVAVNLADQRLSEIRSAPNYSGLETNYNANEPTIAGFTGYARLTQIVRSGGPRPTYSEDYKTVTVTITVPGVPVPIKKTIVVAAP